MNSRLNLEDSHARLDSLIHAKVDKLKHIKAYALRNGMSIKLMCMYVYIDLAILLAI